MNHKAQTAHSLISTNPTQSHNGARGCESAMHTTQRMINRQKSKTPYLDWSYSATCMGVDKDAVGVNEKNLEAVKHPILRIFLDHDKNKNDAKEQTFIIQIDRNSDGQSNFQSSNFAIDVVFFPEPPTAKIPVFVAQRESHRTC